MTRGGGPRRARRLFVAASVTITAGVAAVSGTAAMTAPSSGGAAAIPTDVTIASPEPYFMQLSGQGPALGPDSVAWTAINPQGQAGSQANRIYLYDLARHRLSVPVRSHFGATGFIGDYAMSGSHLAYVDTGLSSGGRLTWRVVVQDLRTDDGETIAASAPGGGSQIAPQIAYDGTHLLLLQTLGVGATGHEGLVTLYTLGRRRQAVLERVGDRFVGDPALAHDAAMWTTIDFGPHPSSRLTLYSLTRHTLSTPAVGDVSQLAASGDTVVWKSGMTGVRGHIGLYSVSRGHVIAPDLARSDHAVDPATDGNTVSWTLEDGSRVQVYSIPAGRVVYSTPRVAHRVYGLTAVLGRTVSWTWTQLGVKPGAARGYVVVHRMA